MTQPFLGEVRMFAGDFAPRGNAMAAGQLMSISQNAALFSLLGTTYGGNGVQTFGLPDMRSRIPVDFGQGNGLSNYELGQMGGTESVTLNINQIPAHNHNIAASTTLATQMTPAGQVLGQLVSNFVGFYFPSSAFSGTTTALNTSIVGMTGGNQPHENRMPTLAITYIVALVGLFPSRN